MYHLIISEYDNIINVKLHTMTEVLDFISLLNLSYNQSLFITIMYEKGEDADVKIW